MDALLQVEAQVAEGPYDQVYSAAPPRTGIASRVGDRTIDGIVARSPDDPGPGAREEPGGCR